MDAADRVIRRFLSTRAIPVDKSRARELAGDAVRELPGHLRFKADDMGDPLWMARGFDPSRWGFHLGVYSTTDVQGNPVNVPVRVRAAKAEGPGRRWVAGGEVTTRYHGDARRGSKIEMVITINSERPPQELLDNLDGVARELYSVLIHEATHLRDLLERSVGDAHRRDPGDYYNRPDEVRAFLQQVADEVADEADRRGIEGMPGSATIDTLLGASPTWERIRGFLDPANTRLVLRGMARALGDRA